MSFIGDSPNVRRLKLNPLSADPLNPEEGDIQYADGTARTEGFWGYKNGAWVELDAGASAGVTGLQNTFSSGFSPFVDEVKIDVPNTDISNRAQIVDPTQTGKPGVGKERIGFYGVRPAIGEAGVDGQFVQMLSSGDPRIRIVGDAISWTVILTQSTGELRTSAPFIDDSYIEVVFYGTGLNFLNQPGGATGTADLFVDGVSSGTVTYTPATSTVLNARGYHANMITPIVQGLTEGLHTVKIRGNSGNLSDLRLQGIEIVNDRTDLRVQAVTSYGGGIERIAGADTDLDIKPAAIVGTKGASVVVYHDSDNVVKQAVNEVDASQLNLTSADHSNEEILQRPHWRKFGVDRADDFTSVSGTGAQSKAFTLEDGLTTLVGSGIGQSILNNLDTVGLVSAGGYLDITFVGTGLDLNMSTGAYTGAAEIFVDGSSIGTIGTEYASGVFQAPIVSGLPYGTHVVRIAKNTVAGVTAAFAITDFIIYGPKKATVPAGGVELAHYYVPADFSANATTSIQHMSSGVIRQLGSREVVYTGTWALAQDVVNYVGGWEAASSTSSGTMSYQFFGTGFDLRFRGTTTNSANITVDLDGTTLTAANFPTASFAVQGTGITFNSGTGVLDQASTSSLPGSGFAVSGLPLALYTVTFTNNVASPMVMEAIDIIAPAHFVDSGNWTGRLTLGDTRNFDALKKLESNEVDLGKAKAWVHWDGSTNTIRGSYNIAAVIEDGTDGTYFYFEKPFKDRYYSVAMSQTAEAQGNLMIPDTDTNSLETHVIKVRQYNDSSTPISVETVMFTIFGELLDE